MSMNFEVKLLHLLSIRLACDRVCPRTTSLKINGKWNDKRQTTLYRAGVGKWYGSIREALEARLK